MDIVEQSSSRAEDGLHPTADRVRRVAFLRNEDWLSSLLGLALIVIAAFVFASGGSVKWLAVAPQKWTRAPEIFLQLRLNGLRYVALFLVTAIGFGAAAAAMGIGAARFLRAFVPIYLISAAVYFLGLWDQAAHYNLEPPLVALVGGLLVSNTVGTPRWIEPGLRVELYIKVGIVSLGSSLPLTLLAWAGPVAILQAALISLATFGVIYAVATRLGLDRRLAATLGTGGAVCGVSGAIAVGGAVGARKQDISVAISLVVVWAIVMIFVLPLMARALSLSTGVAGAWIGTSEFADAAGLAAAQTYGGYAGNVAGISGHPDAAVKAFTLMKVIGRDMWIGVWAFVLSLIAATRWERTGIDSRAGPGEIWRRFPKFVLGFLLASLLVTWFASGDAYGDYKASVVPGLVAPLQALRTWSFTFAFLSIGLTTRLRELVAVGVRPFVAFSVGAAVNVLLGFFLSTRVFGAFWTGLGQ